jgi:hypothetical protein
MRTVPFQTVLAGAHDGAGLELADRSAAQLASAVRKLNRRVAKAWGYDRFADLCRTEPRLYRAEYAAGTAYAAPTITAAREVFFSAAQKYYQALRASTGNAPAALTVGIYVVNSAYWAECAIGYSGDDWATALAYAVATVVRNPADGRYYACHTAHTSAGAVLDTTKFGVLTPFAAYVALDQAGQTAIGEVIRITAADPDVQPINPGVIRHTLRRQGIVPLATTPPARVWVQFRLRVPIFTSLAWNNATVYAVGAVAYLANADGASGECYTAVQGSTNQNPLANTAYWSKLEFPAPLQNFVIRATASDLLRADGQNEKANAEQGQAYAELSDDRDVEVDGQGISETTEVQTY